MGRREQQFTKNDLKEIEFLAGMGLTQKQISNIKGVCADTLRKHAHKAWEQGKSKGIGKVAQAAYRMAISEKHPMMTKFFLQTQAS